MKIGEAEKNISSELEIIYDASESANIARLLLEAVTGFSPTEILLQKSGSLSGEAVLKLKQMIPRLLRHEPVQYVLNKTWFYGMELYVDKHVLIPRPETEELVDWIVKEAGVKYPQVFTRGAMQADLTSTLKILDIGTGSGCIALALKKAMPRAEVWACDVSDEALNVARRNGAALDIRVDFQGVNFLDEAEQRSLPSVDILVSNPPYIPLRDKGEMRPNVVDFEPHTALFVPDNNALVFYEAIAQFSEKRLHQKGTIYLEIHEELGNAVGELFTKNGYSSVEIKKDMQGKERMLKASR